MLSSEHGHILRCLQRSLCFVANHAFSVLAEFIGGIEPEASHRPVDVEQILKLEGDRVRGADNKQVEWHPEIGIHNIKVNIVASEPIARRLAHLDAIGALRAVRLYLAWKSIEAEKVSLDLTPFQANQVDQKKTSSDQAVKGRIPETYVWLLAPGQKRPEPGKAFPDIEWQEIRLQGQEALAERASKKLKNEELLITSMAGTRLHLEITQIPLWRAPGNHVAVKQLVDDFAKYLYLPRVKNAQVILDAIQDGVARLTWKQDTFAYADSYDAAADRYRALEAGRRPNIQLNSESVVVNPEIAAQQMEKEAAAQVAAAVGVGETGTADTRVAVTGAAVSSSAGVSTALEMAASSQGKLKRFHGSAQLNATRLSRDVDAIASSVVQHLAGLLDAEVKITLEIAAEIPSGAPENIVRTVTENCRTLKFKDHGFEES